MDTARCFVSRHPVYSEEMLIEQDLYGPIWSGSGGEPWQIQSWIPIFVEIPEIHGIDVDATLILVRPNACDCIRCRNSSQTES